MAHRVCYIVDKRVDGYIASKFGWKPSMGSRGLNPRVIASLRGLYDTQADENDTPHLLPDDVSSNDLTDEQLDKAFKDLMNFRISIRKVNQARMAKASKHIERAYDALRHAYSLHERSSRVSLLSNLFSYEVDRLMQGHNIDRQAFVNGFRTVDGEYIGGEFSILESVYNEVNAYRQNFYEQMLNPQKYFQEAVNSGNLDYYNAPKTVEDYAKLAEHQYNEYTKILENWNSLVPFVLKDLVQKEGVKLGIKKEYASTASSDSYGDNDIAAKWDLSESKRDGWQENSDLQSAFGSIGQQVRRILATVPMMKAIPIIENGKFIGYEYKRVVDDLGNQVFIDPIKTHQSLVEFLQGIQDSNDMINRMSKKGEPGTARIAWMQPILDVLTSNSQARTQFFVDFKKNFQPYSIMFEDEKNSRGRVRSIKTRILNRPKNILKGKYEALLSLRDKDNTPENKNFVAHKDGTVNWQRLADLRKEVLAWTKENDNRVGVFATGKNYGYTASPLLNNGKNSTITIDGKTQRLTYDMKREFLMDVFYSLGIDATMDTIDSILNSRDIYTVREQLEQLFDPKGETGIIYALSGNSKSNFRTLSANNKSSEDKSKALKALDDTHMKFRGLYRSTVTTSDGRKIVPVEEHIGKLLDIIGRHQEGYRVESRVRYNGNTMYSFVAPSYLGDRLEALKSYVDNDDKQGLMTMLKDEFLNSPYFVDDEYIATNGEGGKILNTWLEAIVNACKDKNTPLVKSVASIFSYERDLGRDDKKFEDFTSKEHAIDMFIHFFADEQQSKGYEGKGRKDINRKLSALYPTFILGDAGVSKYIRAPRHTSAVRVDKNGNVLDEADADKTNHIEYKFDNDAQQEVLDGFWNIYLQERRRMGMEKAISYQMYANGKPVKHGEREFSILTFLNPNSDEYNPKYRIGGHEEDEGFIRNVIRQYLDDASLNGIEYEENGRKITTPSFKQRLETLGVLETTDSKKSKAYNYISSVATPDNIDDKVREFYWNTKLATAQQLQIMTIDPSFYHGTKDLQKRYKEIHAPGSVLDTEALDFEGNKYSEDGIERVAYFEDIAINAEKVNPEFMETILRLFAKEDADVDTAIKDGILTPQEDKLKETERQDKLAGLLGDNYSIYKSYMKNTLTDGQGYRTLKSYRKIMGMAGKWTQNMENAYKTIMSIRDNHQDGSSITPEEMRTIASYALVLQPIKPYMFTHEKYNIKVAKKVNGQTVIGTDGKPVMIDSTMIIPVQHKYAEALIIPELMPKGSKLRDLGLWMDAHNVDMVGSTKIAKVGCFGQAHIDKASNTEELNTAMSEAYVHELPYRDYRIQTNVPEHINSSQLFGTQVRKLIMAGLTMDADYSSYIGRDRINLSTSDDENDSNRHAPMKGRNLLALYNSLICANIFDSYEKFSNNANDIEKLSELLQQSTVGSMREAMDNLFSYVVTGNEKDAQRFLMPLFEGGLEHDSAALILSTFKKIVNKQQISGGSAVQVSAFGINGYEEDGGLRYVQDPDNHSNILYAEIEMPFDRTYTIDVKNADGSIGKQKVNLDYDKYCNLDGTLIPTGEALEKGTDEWKKYQSYTYKEVDGKLVSCKYDDPEAKVYKPLIEEDYPDILSILAYRIPTERDYSMINCRIKRFTSKMAGGTLKVPPQGTTIAGFDFDIDKLYFMQREYHKHYRDDTYTENHFSDADKWSVWTAFYENNPEVMEALDEARNAAELKDPSLVTTKTLRSGKQRIVHNTPLNAYWGTAGIEDRFGINKHEAFAETAQQEGIKPTENITKGTKTEWMETYDFDKSPEENTRSARNNLLISLIQARLSDPQTAKERYTPGGFDNAHKAARFMRELDHGDLSTVTKESNGVITSIDLSKVEARQDDKSDPEPNYDPTDPYTILVYNQQNQVAGKLIGIFANESTNHAFASAMDVFELNEPIKFCGHSYKDLLHKGADSWKINRNVAEFLAASVDAVKDPVLNFMNLNTITADAGAVLARLGYSMNEIALLLKQPVIMKACEESFNRGTNVNTILDEIRKDLMNHLTGVDTTSKVDLTSETLALGIVNERKMREEGKTTDDFLADNAKTQLAVLNLMSQLLKASQDVLAFVLNTKFTASNAVSSTFGGMYAQQLKVQEYLNKFPKSEKDKGSLSYRMVVAQGSQETGMFSTPIENREENVDLFGRDKKKDYLRHVRFNPFAYEQAMYDANRATIKLLAKYYPYETSLYTSTRGRMQELARYGTLSEDDINAIHSNIPVALLAKQIRSLFNGEAAHKVNGETTNITNREYYRQKFAEDLAKAVANDKTLAGLKIFQYISPSSDFVEDGKDPKTGLPKQKEVWRIDMQDVGGLDPDTKEEIRESWAYLMEVNDEGFPANEKYFKLGRDLFMYCFYQLGFDFSPLSFMHLAPTAVKDNIIVERENSLPFNSFDTITPDTSEHPSDDVLVWSNNDTGKFYKVEEFGVDDRNLIGELSGNSFKLHDKLSKWDVLNLVNEAKSHPELKFKIDRDLTEEEFNLFTGKITVGDKDFDIDVPSNVYFSKGTLENISEDSKEKISYGRNRTYREFLNEILDGKESSINSDEFAQMFILNHLDNSRFVMNIGNGNKRLKEIISRMPKDANGNITVDVSNFTNESDRNAVGDIVKLNEAPDGTLLKAAWCPAIRIGDSYYMAQSGEDKFNENTQYSITYVKVEPWGASKTITYDGGKKLAPQMRYQSSLFAEPQRNEKYISRDDTPLQTEQQPESPTEPKNSGNGNLDALRQMAEDYIFNEFVKAVEKKNGAMTAEDKQGLRDTIAKSNTEDLNDTVDAIRKACRENGVMMLDEEGNPMMGC